MRRQSNILRGIAIATALLGVTLFSACNKNNGTKLVLSANPTTIVSGNTTSFTVTFDGADVTSEAIITNVDTDTQVENATWTTDAAGTYRFKATYNNATSKQIEVTVTESTDDEMIFAPSFAASVKSIPDQIGVFVSATGQEEFGDEATANILYNQLVTKSGDNWVYTPIKNWAGGNNSFFAYAPYATTENGITISTQTATGAPVLTYTMNQNSRHSDIMIATPVMNATASTEPIELEFRSVMTRIGFRIRGEEDEKITKIALRGLMSQGSIALNAADQGTATWTPTGTFALTEYNAGLVYDDGQEYLTATEEMTNVTAEDGYLYVLPQNVNYECRMVVTINGKDVGFPIETALQWSPGQDIIFDIDIANKPLDYTDNESPAFIIAPNDGASAQNVSWATAMSGCDEGYHLPTYNEGIMVLLYMNGIENNKFRFASYWTSTEHTELDPDLNKKQSLFFDPARNILGFTIQEGLTAFRCIKKNEAPGTKYPYVDTSDAANGPIIVSRDANGGTIESAMGLYGYEQPVFHDNWETTPEHTADGAANLISRKLQVANADLSSNQIAIGEFTCPTGWRTPTTRELWLIRAMGGAVSTAYITDTTSPYYNPAATDTPLNNVAGFTPMKLDTYWSGSKQMVGRGTLVPSGISMTDAMSRPGQDAATVYYARCVRDVE